MIMTHRDRKRAIRVGMAETGESFAVAARAIAEERAASQASGAAAGAGVATGAKADDWGFENSEEFKEEIEALRERLLASCGHKPDRTSRHICPETGSCPACGNPVSCPACGDPGCRELACPEGKRAAAQIVSRLDPRSLIDAWREAVLDVAVSDAAREIDNGICDAICNAVRDVPVGGVCLHPAQIPQLRLAAGPPLDAVATSVLTRAPVASLTRAVSARYSAEITKQVGDELEMGIENRTSDLMLGRWYTFEGAGQ